MADPIKIMDLLVIMDELGYQPRKTLKKKDFLKRAIYDLNHAETLDDAAFIVQAFVAVASNWGEIEEYRSKDKALFRDYPYQGPRKIRLFEGDEDLDGTLLLTNAMLMKPDEVDILNVNVPEEILPILFFEEEDAFSMNENGYRLRFDKASRRRMALFDKAGSQLCRIFLSEDGELLLEDNLTPYIIRYDDQEELLEVFSKEYIDSMKEGEEPKWQDCHADIEWQLLEEDEFAGFALSRLTAFLDCDLEMLLMIASAPILIEGRLRGKLKV